MYLRTLALFALLFISQANASDNYEQYLSLLGFKLEETDLFKVKEKLGDSEIKQSMDVTGPKYSICYFINKDKTTVHFESGLMGGKQHQLLAFSVKYGTNKSEGCSALAVSGIETHLGVLHLGEKIKLVKKALPQPVEDIPGHGYLHKHFYKRPFSKKDIQRTGVKDMSQAFWSVSIFIEVFESQGKVTGYKVSKQTSW